MCSQRVSCEPGFLINADCIAEASRLKEVSLSLKSVYQSSVLCAALKHPYLRALIELYCNDSVDAHGAITLQALGYAKLERITDVQDDPRGRELSYLELTEIGISHVNDIRYWYEDAGWFIALQSGVTGYACRDLGLGICAGRNFLQYAVQYRDTDLLRIIVDPGSFSRQFSALGNAESITEQERLSFQLNWSPRFSHRRSAAIVAPIFEFSSGFGVLMIRVVHPKLLPEWARSYAIS